MPYLYAGICLIIIVAASVVALESRDFHLMNRAGASVAAVSALFVIVQVYLEFSDSSNVTNQRQRIIELRTSILNQAATQPQAAQAILSAELHRLEKELLHRRLRVAAIVSAFAFVGEALHGWGDVLFECLFG
jgi:hypothetical protein